MSIKIISLHKNNVLFTELDNISSFVDVLISDHVDIIENATDEFILKLDILQDRFHLIKRTILKRFGILTLVDSGHRTPSINAKVGGKPTSQHLETEALDLHFYHKNGNRILDKKILENIFDYLIEVLCDSIQQLFLYNTFIHCGFATSRKVSFRRGNL